MRVRVRLDETHRLDRFLNRRRAHARTRRIVDSSRRMGLRAMRGVR